MNESLKQLLVIVAGAMGIFAISGGLMVAIEWLRPDGHNTQLNTEISGLAGIIVTQLFLQWRTSVKIEKKGEDVKKEIQVAPEAVKNAADEAKLTLNVAAERAAIKLERTADSVASRVAPPQFADQHIDVTIKKE